MTDSGLSKTGRAYSAVLLSCPVYVCNVGGYWIVIILIEIVGK